MMILTRMKHYRHRSIPIISSIIDNTTTHVNYLRVLKWATV